MSTLETKLGEIELVDGFDEAIEYKLLADLIELWETHPENIDRKAIAYYFKPVSPECYVNLFDRYKSNIHDFTSYAVVRSLAEHFDVGECEGQTQSALWFESFIKRYGVKITKLIADEVSISGVDLHHYAT